MPLDVMEATPSRVRGDWFSRPNIIVISSAEQPHRVVEVLLGGRGWFVHSSFTRQAAERQIQELQPAVLLCADKLPDGDWTEMLHAAAALPLPPRVIVFSRLAAEALWTDVLDLGAFDLIGFPFDTQELLRVAEFALACWQREKETVGYHNGLKPARDSRASAISS
jgi:DNA-binding response OmpR family regulator